MKNKSERILNIAIPILTVLAIIVLWIIVSVAVNNEYALPTVWQTFAEMFALFGEGEFYLALLYTLLRSLIAFLISFILAIALAYLSKKYLTARKIIAPIIRIIRALPTIAIALLLVFWVNSQIAPAIVTTLVVMPTLFSNAQDALDSVDDNMLTALRFHKVPEKEIFFKVQLPIVSPALIKAAGSGLSLNIKLMVAAEVLSETAYCIGYLLKLNKVYFEIATMMALVLITVIICVIIETVANLISKKVGKWK